MKQWPMLTVALVIAMLSVNAQAFGGMGGKMGSKMEGAKGKPAPEAQENAAEEKSEPNPEVVGAFMPTKANRVDMRKRGFFETGLKPVYPDGVKCPVITSFFSDPKRTDGSIRSPRYYQGLHSGVDIPMPEGTPVVAMADGTVVSKTEGENIGGIGIVVKHSPEDTGLPYYTFTEYKHFVKLPDFPIGHRVHMGEEIGQAGISGTTGGHFGEEGLSHLHWSAWFNESGEYKDGRMFVPTDGRWADPLALLRGLPIDSASVKNLPDEQKQVVLPYKDSKGQIKPAGTKVIWPFVCEAK
jgi:murein DD-endopeptidase MepM/ murein hydrolase activator NlpD